MRCSNRWSSVVGGLLPVLLYSAPQKPSVLGTSDCQFKFRSSDTNVSCHFLAIHAFDAYSGLHLLDVLACPAQAKVSQTAIHR